MKPFHRTFCAVVLLLLVTGGVLGQTKTESSQVPYLKLIEPRRVMRDAQPWEGDQFPHTLSVLDLKQGGFRYWGWYGLNEGRGIGLARSNDLVIWTKYENNPLWTNARWPSVLAHADPNHKDMLYFAITREYDTPSSHIVLASSQDGIHLKEEKVLVAGVPNQRNQNPNLFRDPRSRRFYLTFYRGNDKDHFEIISKSAIPCPTSTRPRRKSCSSRQRHGGGAHLALCEERQERQRQENRNLLSRNRSLSPPLHHRPRGRVAGQSIRQRLTGWRLPARAGQSGSARTTRLLVPARIRWPVLWL